MLCFQCKTQLCAFCRDLPPHVEHRSQVGIIAEMVARRRLELKLARDQLGTTIRTVDESVAELAFALNDLKVKESEACTRLRSQVRPIHSALEKREQELLDHLRFCSSLKTVMLNDQQSTLSDLLSSLPAAYSNVKSFLDSTEDNDMAFLDGFSEHAVKLLGADSQELLRLGQVLSHPLRFHLIFPPNP